MCLGTSGDIATELIIGTVLEDALLRIVVFETTVSGNTWLRGSVA